MNREIKFRAWDKKDKEMLCIGTNIFDLMDGLDPEYWKENAVMMLWTGLKDKNGKEIYEADLVQHPEYSTPLRVEWDYDQWGLFDGICNEATLYEECEIIGNIYENADLISG
jgi:YopX protein